VALKLIKKAEDLEQVLAQIYKTAKIGTEYLTVQAHDPGEAFSISVGDLVSFQGGHRHRLMVDFPEDEAVEVRVSDYDPEHNQVVIHLKEKAHKVKRSGTQWLSTGHATADDAKADEAEYKERGRNRLLERWIFPEGTTHRFSNQKINFFKAWMSDRYVSADFSASVTFSVPEQETTFLVGTDESELFISILPKKVTSVAAAHNALRPAGVPADAVRQGEFFFVPVTSQADKNRIFKVLKEADEARAELDDVRTQEGLYGSDGEYSDHRASFIVSFFAGNGTDPIDYAQGFVSNYRHKPLWLEGWHRVYLNRELASLNGHETYD
jgi:hypothetical protein